ncbi:unnamed protein product, partial [Ilex paraguariensis]
RPGSDNPQPKGPSENQGEQRKKARHEAQMKLIQEKNVTYERYLDHISLTPRNEVVRIIEAHGMKFWFEPVDGFNLSMCREFYQTLRVADVNEVEVLKTNVRGKIFVVTSDVIVTFLGNYERPPNFPPPCGG